MYTVSGSVLLFGEVYTPLTTSFLTAVLCLPSTLVSPHPNSFFSCNAKSGKKTWFVQAKCKPIEKSLISLWATILKPWVWHYRHLQFYQHCQVWSEFVEPGVLCWMDSLAITCHSKGECLWQYLCLLQLLDWTQKLLSVISFQSPSFSLCLDWLNCFTTATLSPCVSGLESTSC